MREKYQSLALADLKAIAKVRGLKGISLLKKSDLIELMLKEEHVLRFTKSTKFYELLFRKESNTPAY